MPRLREVPLAEADEKVALPLYRQLFGERDPVSEPGTATGTRGDWWSVFANSPDTLRHAAQGFAYYRAPARKLDPVLRELGQTWAGWATYSQFVFSQHCKSLRGLGVSEAKIEALPVWQTAEVFDAKERLVLAYADLLQEAGRPTLLILDDALVHSDTQRLDRMKRVLFDTAQRHQVLLFTCHPAAWRDMGVVARTIARG